MNPVALLKHSWSATLALVLCMWAQIPHSQHVFEHWAKGQSGSAFAWGFEAAVLMFVVRGMHGASWTFAGLSALINVGYYGLQDVQMWTRLDADNWLCWLLSLALPFTIAMYSHVLADVQGEGMHVPDWVPLLVAKGRSWLMLDKSKASTQPIVDVQPSAQPIAEPEPSAPPDNASTQIDDTQPISEPLLAQLDEMNERIVASIRNGNYTPYAIAKDTGITLTTLKRRKGKNSDEYTGRLPQLIEMGIIHNSSGADGSEYRLVE